MNAETGNQSDSDDTLTSSDLSDYDGDREDDDFCDTQSCRSLAFSLKSNRSTATVKNAKTKKRVRFKAGDKLVLVYVIPNREMLGLHSASESSDSEYSASDSDDEDDADADAHNKHEDDSEENDDDDIDDDDDDEDEEDDTDEDDDDDDDKQITSSVKKVKPKARPIGRLVSIKQVNTRKPIDFPKPLQKMQEPVHKVSNVDLSQTRQKRPRSRRGNKIREKRERVKVKTESVSKLADKPKKERIKKYRNGAIKTDIDTIKSSKRKRGGRLLEIKATVETNHKTNVHVPKLVYKHDFRPSVIDVNSSSIPGTKQLVSRSKLQPTSIRLSKRPDSSNTTRNKDTPNSNTIEKPRRARTVISSCYDSVSSLLPSSYSTLHEALQKHTIEESIQRLDPNDMNTSGKRLYAWQIANGNITSQSLRTPSILPFLDTLKTSTVENG